MEPLEAKKPKGRKHLIEDHYFLQTPEERRRFLERYENFKEKDKKTGCWNFYGGRLPNGYGTMTIGSHGNGWSRARAHRLAWVIYYESKIPTGLCVCHSCDNRICVNPLHLSLATSRINIKERDLKGRGLRGTFKNHGLSIIVKKNIVKRAWEDPLSFSYTKEAKKYKKEGDAIRGVLKRSLHLKDKSFLPEHLQKLYASCKSWKEVKLVRAEYVKQQSINQVQEAG